MSTNIYDYTEAIAELIAKHYKYEDLDNLPLLKQWADQYLKKYFPKIKYNDELLNSFVIVALRDAVRSKIMDKERREEREHDRGRQCSHLSYIRKLSRPNRPISASRRTNVGSREGGFPERTTERPGEEGAV